MQEESISYIDRDISSYSGLYDIEISLYELIITIVWQIDRQVSGSCYNYPIAAALVG